MTAQGHKKLTQLSRRLTAAKARYGSLEKRSALVEDKRTRLEENAGRLFDLLMSAKGARAGSKRRLSLATAFKKAKDRADQLRTLEDKVYGQLKETEEKIATLKDNMRKVSRKNPKGAQRQRAYDKRIGEYVRKLQSEGLSSTQIADRIFQRFGQIVRHVTSDQITMRGVKGKDYIVKLRNPRGKHLAGATAKQQRQYEHILESALESGRYGKRAKEVAARTVRAHGNPTGSAADSAKWEKLWGNYIKALQGYDAEAAHLPRGRDKFKAARMRLAKAEKAIKDFDRAAYEKYIERRNPSSMRTLKKAGRSAKRAVKATLDAGSKLLGAGAKALKNAVNLRKFPDDKLQSYKADLESSLTKLRASGGGKATIRFVQGRINAVNRELKKRNPDYPYWKVYHIDTKKSPPYDKTFLGSSHFNATRAEAIGQFRRSHYPGRLRAGTRIVAEKAVITKNPHRVTLAQARKMGADHARAGKKLTPYDAREADKILLAAAKAQDPERPARRYAELRGAFNEGWQEAYYKSVSNLHKRIKVRNAYIDLMIKGQAKKTPSGWKVGRKTFSQGRGTTKVSSGYYLDKATGFVYAKRQRANPKRKRNLDHKDSGHQVHVHQHWRSGGLSQWQRAHHAGQRPLFEHGIKVKPKRNPKRIKKGDLVRDVYGKAHEVLSVRGNVITTINGAHIHKTKAWPIKKDQKPQRNPSATSIRKKFAGRVTGAKTMYYAKGAPSGSMAKLGKLASIKIQGRRNPIKPTRRNPSVDLWLCCDTHGKLWLASSKPGLMFDGPPQNLGKITEIEYVESKPHLGNPHQTLYFHKLGEETGQKPSLLVDQHGDLLIKGGAYRVTGRGIEN